MGGLVQLLPILLIIGVFYILLIRPQQKRQRELQETISQLKAGTASAAAAIASSVPAISKATSTPRSPVKATVPLPALKRKRRNKFRVIRLYLG